MVCCQLSAENIKRKKQVAEEEARLAAEDAEREAAELVKKKHDDLYAGQSNVNMFRDFTTSQVLM